MYMKKYLLGIGLVSLGLTISSCNKAAEEEAEATEQDTAQAGGVKIAYVELDSLMNQYQLYKDYSEVLTHKGNNIQNTLAMLLPYKKNMSATASQHATSWSALKPAFSVSSRNWPNWLTA